MNDNFPTKEELKEYIFSLDLINRKYTNIYDHFLIPRSKINWLVYKYELRKYIMQYRNKSLLNNYRDMITDYVYRYLRRMLDIREIRSNIVITDKDEEFYELNIILLSYDAVIQTNSELTKKVPVKNILYTNDKDYSDIVNLTNTKIKIMKLMDRTIPIYEKEIKQVDCLDYFELCNSFTKEQFRNIMLTKSMIMYEDSSRNIKNDVIEKIQSGTANYKLILQYFLHCDLELKDSETTISNLTTIIKRLGRRKQEGGKHLAK